MDLHPQSSHLLEVTVHDIGWQQQLEFTERRVLINFGPSQG